MESNLSRNAELMAHNLPIAATDRIADGYVSRTTLWRLCRKGMPVTRIGNRIFVKFSDLKGSNSAG